MYTVQFILMDNKQLGVEVENEDLSSFLLALQDKKPYFNSEKGIGFWLPPENLKYAYIRKLTQPQEEPCQNQNSDQANVLPS